MDKLTDGIVIIVLLALASIALTLVVKRHQNIRKFWKLYVEIIKDMGGATFFHDLLIIDRSLLPELQKAAKTTKCKIAFVQLRRHLYDVIDENANRLEVDGRPNVVAPLLTVDQVVEFLSWRKKFVVYKKSENYEIWWIYTPQRGIEYLTTKELVIRFYEIINNVYGDQ